MSALQVLAEYTAGAVLCPHPEARAKHVMYVRDPAGREPAMGLCGACQAMFADLATRADVVREDVFRTMLASGYTHEDAVTFWADVRRERRRRRLAALLGRVCPGRQEVCA